MTISSFSQVLGDVGRATQEALTWATYGPKLILNDIDATADLLRLTQSVYKVTDLAVKILPLKLISDGISTVVEFFNAKNMIGSIYNLASGHDAWENPLSPHVPNVFKVASKAAFLVGDVGSFVSWLSTLKLLGSWVKDTKVQIPGWGKPFSALGGICDASCITGSLLSLADTMRMIAKEAIAGVYVKNGRLMPGTLINRGLDVVSDISSIASSVLGNIPGLSIVFSLVASAVGSTVSLGKFFIWQYEHSHKKESVAV